MRIIEIEESQVAQLMRKLAIDLQATRTELARAEDRMQPQAVLDALRQEITRTEALMHIFD